MTKIFNCAVCKYKTTKTSSWKKHLQTLKHKSILDNVVEWTLYVCKACNKSYSHASGLSRHKKKCKILTIDNELKIKDDNEMLLHNKMETLIEETRVLKYELKNIKLTTINNTSQLNINLFLNQNCKDAMNLTDFIHNLKYTIDDLAFSGKNGYVAGVSNILIKNLTTLTPNERPLHCSDSKRLKFYVKDNDTWERDEGNIKMSKSIDDISEKQRQKLKEWQEQNPEYEQSNIKSEEFFNIVRGIMGGGHMNELNKNKNKIIKSLSSDVTINSIMSS